MAKPRAVETDRGIQGEFNVALYDRMQRHLRDRGWMETRSLLKSGIRSGLALELGPGPGLLGLEWLKSTEGTRLQGLDISPDMISTARRNAGNYGLSGRAEYQSGSGNRMPFGDRVFDAVFRNGSLHEWADPRGTFGEIARVLKSGGRFFLSDLRRDMPRPVRWFLWMNTTPREMRPGLLSSIAAAYTPGELRELAAGTRLAGGRVSANLIGLCLEGVL